jgi:hypothetical protein
MPWSTRYIPFVTRHYRWLLMITTSTGAAGLPRSVAELAKRRSFLIQRCRRVDGHREWKIHKDYMSLRRVGWVDRNAAAGNAYCGQCHLHQDPAGLDERLFMFGTMALAGLADIVPASGQHGIPGSLLPAVRAFPATLTYACVPASMLAINVYCVHPS